MKIETKIFKAYDIRGIYPEQLNEESAYALGRAYATFLFAENGEKKLKVGVSSDARISGPTLKARVIEGLLDSGIDVEDFGVTSTPTFYFGIGYFGYDGGLQVSASHNPKEYNGLKMVRRHGAPLSKDSGIMEMRDIVLNDSFCPLAEPKGTLAQRNDILATEVEDLLGRVDVLAIKPFKIVAEAYNAVGALDLEALFAKLPVQLIKQNFELDGTFPSGDADPMPEEHTVAIRKRVVAEKADLGIATDGDGDRYFFVDEKGEMLPQSILRGIMALIELEENPGATVVYDIRPGRITKDMIDEHGGRAIVAPVGHSLIKELMVKENAIFGGESSGHYAYKLPYGTLEAPLLLVLKLLVFISKQNKPFSEIIAPFKRYYHSGEVNLKVEGREEVEKKIELVKEKYKDGEQNFLDGLTVEYPDFWFNIRASNTEPLLRFALEARSKEVMEAKREEIKQILMS
jgi:phosphomannomutase